MPQHIERSKTPRPRHPVSIAPQVLAVLKVRAKEANRSLSSYMYEAILQHEKLSDLERKRDLT
jgi:hypothetical protein